MDEHSPRIFVREKSVHQVLGGGKFADLFLWRDKKFTAVVLVNATSLWVLIELFGYNLLRLVSHCAILPLAVLFLWSKASTFIKIAPPHIPDVYIAREPVLQFVDALRFDLNRTFAFLREIAPGRDLRKFLSVITGFWVLSIVGTRCNLLTLSYIVFVLLHIVPLLCEKYKDQEDSFAAKAHGELEKQHARFLIKIRGAHGRRTRDMCKVD